MNSKWTAQELLSHKHSFRAPATETMQMSGKQQQAQGWFEQVSARTYPLTLKKNLCKSHGHGMLGYFLLPPPSPRHCAILMHT